MVCLVRPGALFFSTRDFSEVQGVIGKPKNAKFSLSLPFSAFALVSNLRSARVQGSIGIARKKISRKKAYCKLRSWIYKEDFGIIIKVGESVSEANLSII